MNKRTTKDQVISELWSIKDETGLQFPKAGDYLAHLRQKMSNKKPSSKRRVRAA